MAVEARISRGGLETVSVPGFGSIDVGSAPLLRIDAIRSVAHRDGPDDPRTIPQV